MAGLALGKKNKGVLRWVILSFTAVLIIASCYFAYKWFTEGQKPPLIPLPASAYADSAIDETPVDLGDINSYTVPASHPRYISIPSVGVSKARVQQVGLTENKLIDTPRNISDVGWYKESALPGQGYGSVIINGHNKGMTRDGIFAQLGSLKSGDEIIIERGDGEQIIYRVVENKKESLQQATTTGLKRLMTPYNTSEEGLGLIATSGTWIPRDKVFDERILVRAVVASDPGSDELLNE